MSATYTIDIFMTLDGFASFKPGADWGGYWGKQGPEFLDRRLAMYGEQQRMVLGANTFKQFVKTMGLKDGVLKELDSVNAAMRDIPATVISTSLTGNPDWPDATIISGDAVDVIAKLKRESLVPLRSHGSLSMNRALLAAGLVDKIQLTIFPVISGQTGDQPVFKNAGDFDLELIESIVLDGNTIENTYKPILHNTK
jgi:dihydrofolate reductase